ncbi:acid-sensing ion channel 1-like [Halichondria panicea]|uniref:acid-sensing ion channel 1-like n=1 Tax=Halichondria panicea TaxID=6063 RepID=UPI00312B6241
MEDSIAVEEALNNKGSLKRRILQGDKKKFQKYVNSTTTHGVKHIFNGKSFIRRSFWAILFILCLIGCLNGIISSIIAYSKIPTSTTVYTDHVDHLTFPAVTICNLNGYNVSYLEENNLTRIITTAVYDEDNIEQCGSFVPHNFPKNRTLYDTVLETSQSIDNLIAGCHFLGKKCKSSDFIQYVVPNGKCFTFNGRNAERNYKTVTGDGFRHALELVLNIQQDEFGGSVNSEVGALISVHEQNVPARVWETGVTVPVGHSAYLAVTREQIVDRTNRGNLKELECVQPADAPQFELFTSYNYSFSACRGECITQSLVDTCECLWTNSRDSPYRNCNISDICCIYTVLKKSAECPCSVLCNHTSYEVVPSYSTFPSSTAVNAIADSFNVSRETIQNNYLKVHVFYKSLSINKQITEISYTFTELIANIGGNMGLFLGASIISLTEFLTMILDQIKDRLFGIRERKLRSSLDKWLVKKLKVDQSYEPEIDALEKVNENEFVNSYVDFATKNRDTDYYSTEAEQ